MRRFSIWLDPLAEDETSYGKIDNFEWVCRECERLNYEYGKALFFVRNSDEGVAIYTTLPGYRVYDTGSYEAKTE